MRIGTCLALTCLLAAFGTERAAADVSRYKGQVTESYSHNGSAMAVEFDGPSLVISYAAPRRGLISAGVNEGTIVFSGHRSGSLVNGTAYVFKHGCGTAPYPVQGRFDRGDNLVLIGSAPRWDPGSCAIIGYTTQTSHARLVFEQAFGDY
jgi:hypothetical protein